MPDGAEGRSGEEAEDVLTELLQKYPWEHTSGRGALALGHPRLNLPERCRDELYIIYKRPILRATHNGGLCKGARARGLRCGAPQRRPNWRPLSLTRSFRKGSEPATAVLYYWRGGTLQRVPRAEQSRAEQSRVEESRVE